VGRNFLKGLFVVLLAAMAWPAEGALQWRTQRATLRRQGQPAPQPASPFATINTRTPATSGPVNTTANGFTTFRRQGNRAGAVGRTQRAPTFTERNPLSARGPWHSRVFNRWYTSTFNFYQQTGREIPSSSYCAPDYDLRREQFQVTMPTNYNADREWGLFIWISPGPQPSLPPNWRSILGRQGYIICELKNASNNRVIHHRIGLALDARHNLVKQYNIDTSRVCISGHSGGSKCAVIAATCFPDQFARVITFMGCNTYVDLPGGRGKYYSASFDKPEQDILQQTRGQSRFVLVAGERDTMGFNAPGSNAEQTVKAYHHQFKKENYSHAHLVVVPSQGHGLPGGNWLEHALQLLDREEE